MYTYQANLKISLTSLHLNSFKIYKEYSSKYLGWQYPDPAWLVTYDVVEDETVVDMAVSVHRDVHSSAVLHGMLLWNRSQDVGLCVRSSWKFRLLVINVQQLNEDCDGVFQHIDDATVVGFHFDLKNRYSVSKRILLNVFCKIFLFLD